MAKPLSTEPLGECIACHGKHRIMHTSDDLVGDRPGAVCMRCHRNGQKGAEFAAFVSKSLTGYKKDFDRVTALVNEAGQKGMDVTEGMDALQGARQSLIQTRTELHSFAKPTVEAKLKEGEGNLRKAEGFGLQALRENKGRRVGLAISTILLTLVVIGLALKIRSLDQRKS
jgi:predicted CXXCH cytochrome family protein